MDKDMTTGQYGGSSGRFNQSALTRFRPIHASLVGNGTEMSRNLPALAAPPFPPPPPPPQEDGRIPYPMANVGIEAFNLFGAWLADYVSEGYSSYLGEQNFGERLEREKLDVQRKLVSVQKEKQEEAEKFKAESMKLKQELDLVKGQLEDKEKVIVAQEMELQNLRVEDSVKAKRIKDLEDDQKCFNGTIEAANRKATLAKESLKKVEAQVSKITKERDSLQTEKKEFERKTSGQLILLSADKEMLESKNGMLAKKVEKERKLKESSNSTHKQLKEDIIMAALPDHLAELVIKSMETPDASGLLGLLGVPSPSSSSPESSQKKKKRLTPSPSTSAAAGGKMGRMEGGSGNGQPGYNPTLRLERISQNGTSKETKDMTASSPESPGNSSSRSSTNGRGHKKPKSKE